MLSLVSACLATVLMLAEAGGDLPTWVTVGLTPAVVVALLLTGQLRWGKGVDKELARCEVGMAKAEARAEASETRERSLQAGYIDKVLPLQERQIGLMTQVQDFLRALVQEGRHP